MNPRCDIRASDTIELYFYDELEPAERNRFEEHLLGCAACRSALDDLRLIRAALAARPDVASPLGGDWSGFMSRLDARVAREARSEGRGDGRPTVSNVVPFSRTPVARRTLVPYLAMAALLAIVTISVLSVVQWRASDGQQQDQAALRQAQGDALGQAQGEAQASPRAALAAASQQHLERSKLVLLGLTAKDANVVSPEEWTYERELASTLLGDTRLYRMAAEDRGMDTLAGVLRDLELVLIETSFTESDRQALGQIQRLIRKRDLIEKMEVVTSTGI